MEFKLQVLANISSPGMQKVRHVSWSFSYVKPGPKHHCYNETSKCNLNTASTFVGAGFCVDKMELTNIKFLSLKWKLKPYHLWITSFFVSLFTYLIVWVWWIRFLVVPLSIFSILLWLSVPKFWWQGWSSMVQKVQVVKSMAFLNYHFHESVLVWIANTIVKLVVNQGLSVMF